GEIREWQPVKASDDGAFEGRVLGDGYLYVPVSTPSERVMLLEAAGHNIAYVNGEPRAGDPYTTGYVRLPGPLHRGLNSFLCQVSRGRLKARLLPPRAEATLDTGDSTLPDLRVGEETDAWAAVIASNNTTRSVSRLSLRATGPGFRVTTTHLPTLPPL